MELSARWRTEVGAADVDLQHGNSKRRLDGESVQREGPTTAWLQLDPCGPFLARDAAGSFGSRLRFAESSYPVERSIAVESSSFGLFTLSTTSQQSM